MIFKIFVIFFLFLRSFSFDENKIIKQIFEYSFKDQIKIDQLNISIFCNNNINNETLQISKLLKEISFYTNSEIYEINKTQCNNENNFLFHLFNILIKSGEIKKKNENQILNEIINGIVSFYSKYHNNNSKFNVSSFNFTEFLTLFIEYKKHNNIDEEISNILFHRIKNLDFEFNQNNFIFIQRSSFVDFLTIIMFILVILQAVILFFCSNYEKQKKLKKYTDLK